MRGTATTGWVLLGAALLAAVVISIGLYRWDVGARAAETSLRPIPVAPLAASSVPQAPIAAAASPRPVVAPLSSGDAAAGQARFQLSCSPCHPNARAGIGPALYGPAFSQRYPDDAALVAVVRSGRGRMPAFAAAQLPDQDLANIIAYLHSLTAAPPAEAAPSAGPVSAP